MSSGLVFVDASALVPMEVVRDQWHGALQVVLANLRRSGRVRFMTSNWTLYEAMALAARTSHANAVALHGNVLRAFECVTVSLSVESEAVGRFLTWADKGASVVDHANFVLARERRCEAILTFDSDFVSIVRASGIRLLGAH